MVTLLLSKGYRHLEKRHGERLFAGGKNVSLRWLLGPCRAAGLTKLPFCLVSRGFGTVGNTAGGQRVEKHFYFMLTYGLKRFQVRT